MLVGMFHYRKDPSKVSRAYHYAAIAKLEELDFVYFTAKGVDLNNKTINGYIYENSEWTKRSVPFPDVVINLTGARNVNEQQIHRELKKTIPFTSYPVGSKYSVYNRIKKDNIFNDYLIPYQEIKQPIDAIRFINEHQKVVIKPILGNHGIGVIYIEKIDSHYVIKEKINIIKYNRIEFFDYIGKLINKKRILIQKFITCKRKSGETFDIRLHLQKNGNGEWVNTAIYPKIGQNGKFLTNLGQGGQITILHNFLVNEFGDEYYNIKRYLEIFSLSFATHFESLYNHKFDEIGVDIGLDENNKIWLYEVNWRPGEMFIEAKSARNAINYAKYLAKKCEGCKNEEVKTK